MKKEFYELIKADESIFEFIQNFCLDGLWYLDIENPENIWVDRKFWATFGYEPEELPFDEQLMQKLVHPDDLPTLFGVLAASNNNDGFSFNQKIRYLHKNGHIVWIRCQGIVIRDATGQTSRMLGAHTNITSETEAEIAAIESSMLYKSMLDSQSTYIFKVDTEGRYTFVNQHFAQTLGYKSPSEIVGKYYKDEILPEYHERIKDARIACFSDHTHRESLRFKQMNLEGETIAADWEFVVLPRTDGKPAELFCMGIDVTERLLAEEALQKSEERFRFITENTSDGVLVYENGHVVYCSPSYLKHFGNTFEDFPVKRSPEEFFEMVHPEDRTRLIKLILEGQAQQVERLTYQFRALNNFGEYIWREDQANYTYDEEGKTKTTVLIGTNISERKRQEAELLKSKEQFESLVNNIPGITYRCRVDQDWTMMYMSQEVDRLSGYPASDFIDNAVRSYASVILPEDQEMLTKELNSVLAQQSDWEIEYRIKHKNGDIRWAYEKGKLITDEDGNNAFLDGIILDITERKRAEQQLKEQQEMLTEITDSLPGLVLCYKLMPDGTEKISFLSKGVEALIGVEREEALTDAKKLWSRLAPEDVEQFSESIMISARDLSPWSYLAKVYSSTGELIWMNGIGQPKRQEDGSTTWTTLFLDVTDKVLAEQQLRESQEMLTDLTNNLPGLLLRFQMQPDGQGEFKYISKGVESIYQMSQEEVLADGNVLWGRVHPSDLKPLQDSIKEASSSFNTWSATFRLLSKKGNIKWIKAMANPKSMPNGTLLWNALLLEITEQKLAEELVQKTNKQLLLLERFLDHSTDGLQVADEDGKLVYLNRTSANRLAIEKDILAHPTYVQDFEKVFAEKGSWEAHIEDLKQQRVMRVNGINIHQKTGVAFPVEVTATLQNIEGKNYVIASSRDITERQIAETKLREERLLLRTIIDNLPVNVYVKDLDSKKVMANKVEYTFAGYQSEEEVIGKDNFDLFPEDIAKIHLAEDKQVFNTGKSLLQIEGTIRDQNNENRYFLKSKIPLKNESGEIKGLVGISVDITERKLAEIELQEAKEMLEQAGKMAFFGSWNHDLLSNTVKWSNTIREIYEVGEDFVPSYEKVLDFCANEHDRHLLQQNVTAAIETGQAYDLEFQIKTAKGKELWIRAMGKPEFSEGKCKRLIGSLSVTDSVKRNELELRRAKELLEQSSQMSKVGGWELNLMTQQLTWSKIVSEIYEVPEGFIPTAESFIGLLKHEEDRLKIQALFARSELEETNFDLELKILTQHSKDKWIRVIGKTEMQEGKAVRMYGTVQDIDEQKKAALELKVFKNVFDQTADGVGIFTLSDRKYYVNKALVSMLQYSSTREMIRTSIDSYLSDDKEKIEEIKSTILKGQYWKGDLQLKRQDRKTKNIHLSAGPVKNESGQVIAVYGIHTDIDNRKKAEHALKQAKERAEAGNKAKSEFLANMSHEIRTPLNSVIGFSDLLMKTMLNPSQRQYMQAVHQSANSLLDLINDILDFSKIEAGKLEINLEKTDLWELADHAADILKYKAFEKNIEMLVRVQPAMPRFAWLDPIRIRQVLVNLLSNAVKFTEKGIVKIDIYLLEKDANRQQVVRFAVSDTGIGIAPEKQQHIFKAFSQEDGSTTRKYGGTGLGLTISNQLLNLMGSSLQLSSRPKKGSTFYFDLSIEIENGPTVDPKIKSRFNNILLVDDNAESRSVLKEILEIWQMPFTSVENGFSALSALTKGKRFDLLIIDEKMPYLSGIDVVEQVRNKLKIDIKELPIILMKSNDKEPSYKKKSYKNLINAEISKPVNIGQLYEALINLNIEKPFLESTKANKSKNYISTEELTVLIVDDNSINRLLAKTIVADMFKDVEILEAENGKEAVAVFEQNIVDLILMDVQMPEMSGYEATQKIRETQSGKNVSIVALTAGTIKGEKEKCLAAGMDHYLSKPIMRSKMEEVLLLCIDNIISEGNKGNPPVDQNKALHFNHDSLLKKLSGDPETLNTITDFLKTSLPIAAEKLAVAIEAGDNHQLIKLEAHSIKGTALNCCLEILAKMAHDLETMDPYSQQTAMKINENIQKEVTIILELLH